MSYLIGKDYTAPKIVRNVITPEKKIVIKEKIKTFCSVDSKKSYGEIVIEIHKTENYTNDQIIEVIEEVKSEADYTLEEEPKENL